MTIPTKTIKTGDGDDDPDGESTTLEIGPRHDGQPGAWVCARNVDGTCEFNITPEAVAELVKEFVAINPGAFLLG